MSEQCRWREFVEDGDGRGSAARLNMVIGVIIGSITIIWLTAVNNLGGEIFASYMLATGGVYGFSKYRESAVEMQQIKSDSPNQEPAPPPQPPNTVIQVGQPASEVKAKDVSVKAEGDINISPKSKRRR